MIYETIKTYLQNEPRARERRFHQRGMVNLLLEKYPELKEIEKEKLVDFVHDFESYCRIWRKILSENKDLQGEDYEDREIVSQNYQIGLGYEVGYNEDIKKLKTL